MEGPKVLLNKLFLNINLIASITFYGYIISMEQNKVGLNLDNIEFQRTFSPKILKELCAIYIAQQDINLENLGADLTEYTKKIKAIKSKNIPKRLQELFLSIVNKQPLEKILKALEMVAIADKYFNPEEAHLLKNNLANCDKIFFTVEPVLCLIEKLSKNSYLKEFLKTETEILKKYHLEQMTINLNIRSIYSLVQLYVLESNIESAKKLTALIDTVNCMNFEEQILYLSLKISNLENALLNDQLSFKEISDFIKQNLNNNIAFLDFVCELILGSKELSQNFTKQELESFLQNYKDYLKDNNDRFNFIEDYRSIFMFYLLNENYKQDLVKLMEQAIKSQELGTALIIYELIKYHNYNFDNKINIPFNLLERISDLEGRNIILFSKDINTIS